MSKQYALFLSGDPEIEYAIDIENIDEMTSYIEPRKIPNQPKEQLGVIELRGNIISVIDLGATLDYNSKGFQQTPASILLIISKNNTTTAYAVNSIENIEEANFDNLDTHSVKRFNYSIQTLNGKNIVVVSPR